MIQTGYVNPTVTQRHCRKRVIEVAIWDGFPWDFWGINEWRSTTQDTQCIYLGNHVKYPEVCMEPENDGVQKESPFPGAYL